MLKVWVDVAPEEKKKNKNMRVARANVIEFRYVLVLLS
jgi:hypothetical protein